MVFGASGARLRGTRRDALFLHAPSLWPFTAISPLEPFGLYLSPLSFSLSEGGGSFRLIERNPLVKHDAA